VNVSGTSRKDAYFFAANHLVFEKHGFEQNPFEHAVQFKDEIIKKTFPLDSGFEAVYKFNIKESMPAKLFAVIERPDLYTVKCNDKIVTAQKGNWWLDKSFGKIDISKAVHAGTNRISIKASPMTIFCELEPIYILGDFGLASAQTGYDIVPAQKQFSMTSWKAQGMPFYSGEVSYKQKFKIATASGRYFVKLGDWNGSLAKVSVNSKDAGVIFTPPFELDITNIAKAGTNEIEVKVIGTLRNTLGPYHNGPPHGGVGLGDFQKNPASGQPAGELYDTIGYGLFEPFTLINE
jgi:hypothetical protein